MDVHIPIENREQTRTDKKWEQTKTLEAEDAGDAKWNIAFLYLWTSGDCAARNISIFIKTQNFVLLFSKLCC